VALFVCMWESSVFVVRAPCGVSPFLLACVGCVSLFSAEWPYMWVYVGMCGLWCAVFWACWRCGFMKACLELFLSFYCALRDVELHVCRCELFVVL